MATTTKEKIPVDHSAISGAPPKSDTMETMKSLLVPVAKTPEGVSVNVELPVPVKPQGFLVNVKRGRETSPPRVLLVGTRGIGKSTFAAQAPNTIIIPTEDGLDHIDCAKFSWDAGKRNKANSYQEVIAALASVAMEPHDFQSIAIDSVDWLERLIWAHVCAQVGKKNIEDIGYAKGYKFALTWWYEVVDLLQKCRARGMAIILIAHSKIKKFEDPENPAYDRYQTTLHELAESFLSEWVDAVLFATQRRVVKTEGKGFEERNIALPVGANGGERILRTVESPACIAKNRYNLPSEIPLSWAAFEAGLGAFLSSGTKNVA